MNTDQESGNVRFARWATASIAAIIVLAAFLRFKGLGWGLPNDLRSYSYHPDEFLIIGTALALWQSLVPRFYNYPSLFIYFSGLAIAVGTGYGAIAAAGDVYLAVRVMAALMGTAAVLVTYRAGKSLFCPIAGVIAGLVLAIAPLHVQHSHFATVDVPSTLFVAAALGFAGHILRRGSWRDYALAGVMCGLAAGTKYNAGLVFAAVVCAGLLTRDKRVRLLKLLASAGCAIAAFVISTPGTILQTQNVLNGIGYELWHSATGHGLVFAGTGSGFVYTFANSLRYGLWWPLAGLLIVSLLWALWRRDKGALIVLAFMVPYYVLISMSQVRFARYTLPMYPGVALLIGWCIRDIWRRLISWRGALFARTWAAVCVAVFISTLMYTLAIDNLFTQPDPRDGALKWIRMHAPKGSEIGVIDVPWFYSPPYSPTVGFGALPQRREALESALYDIVVFSDCETPGCWKTDPPHWVVVSDYETDDALRLRDNKLISEDGRRQVDRILVDLAIVDKQYTLRTQFSDSLRFVFNFGSTRALPHDMRYPAPTISIYELDQ